MGQVTSLDSITRVYKNNAGKVIGIHCLDIREDRKINPHPIPDKISNDRFKRTASVHASFERFNLIMGQSRVIATVQMIGGYDDFTYNDLETDIIAVEYFGNAETNSLNISLNEFPTIGDAL